MYMGQPQQQASKFEHDGGTTSKSFLLSMTFWPNPLRPPASERERRGFMSCMHLVAFFGGSPEWVEELRGKTAPTRVNIALPIRECPRMGRAQG